MSNAANSTMPKDDADWTQGDLTLISSDNVRFKIPTYHMMAASSFFAGTLTLKPALDDEDKVVHFVDPDFETADTLRLFLLLATKSTVPDDLCYRQLHDLAMFLKKYRCRRPIGVLRSILCCRVDSNNYMNIFAAASYMDRMDLAEFVCGYMLREREKAPSTRTDLYFTALIEWLEENSLTEKTKKRHDSLLQTLRAVLKDKAPLDDPWGVLLKELQRGQEKEAGS